jgi:hypothetical protein
MAEKYARERNALRKSIHEILTGRVLYIDPASKDLGYAISEEGKVIKSGSIHAKGHIAERLRHMSLGIEELGGGFDVVVVEKVRGPRGHIMLLWSVGAAIAASGAPVSLEIPCPMWFVMKDEEYVKGDETDALYISKFVLAFARGDVT